MRTVNDEIDGFRKSFLVYLNEVDAERLRLRENERRYREVRDWIGWAVFFAIGFAAGFVFTDVLVRLGLHP